MEIVYNVTVKVSLEIAAEWRRWMLTEHIPQLMQTGCFTDAKMFRLLEQDDTDGPTFCAQYFCASREDYEKYIAEFAPDARAESLKKWGDKAVAFRSLLQLQK